MTFKAHKVIIYALSHLKLILNITIVKKSFTFKCFKSLFINMEIYYQVAPSQFIVHNTQCVMSVLYTSVGWRIQKENWIALIFALIYMLCMNSISLSEIVHPRSKAQYWSPGWPWAQSMKISW